jgi:glycine dehydrogenase subunit 1
MFYSPLTEADKKHILQTLQINSEEELFSDLPESCNLSLDLPNPISELEISKEIAAQTKSNKSLTNYLAFIGSSAYEHFIPAVIKHITSRSEFYTAYTPYQAEISQGTLHAIFEFQTMVSSLMGLDIANASLYDGASALAEACVMATADTKRKKVLIPAQLHPNYLQVLKTYLEPKNITILNFSSPDDFNLDIESYVQKFNEELAAVVFPYPDFYGNINNYAAATKKAKELGIASIFVCDPHALALFKSPGELGADIAVAEGQPLGLPTSFGGPFLGLMAAKEKYIRIMPGRIVGQSTDNNNNTGYLLTFQTREQHIRREKALSNICSNQGLMALAATVYMSYMGPSGLRRIAELCYKKANYLKQKLSDLKNVKVLNNGLTFKEFCIQLPCPSSQILEKLEKKNILGGLNLETFYPNKKNVLLIATTELKTKENLDFFCSTLRSII